MHSFLDFRTTTKEVKAQVELVAQLLVIVANGHKIMSKLKCSRFTLTM